MTSPPRRLVLDTNVVLDLLVFADPRVAPLAAALADGRAECFVDAAGLVELERVLAYPALRLTPDAAAAVLAAFTALARRIESVPETAVLPRCRDPDDQKFLELAVGIGADALLTRDRALLELATRIRRVSPALQIVSPDTWSNGFKPTG